MSDFGDLPVDDLLDPIPDLATDPHQAYDGGWEQAIDAWSAPGPGPDRRPRPRPCGRRSSSARAGAHPFLVVRGFDRPDIS